MLHDFPILPSNYSADVSVITAYNTSHRNTTSNNLDQNIPSTSNNVQYSGHNSSSHSSLTENMVTLCVPTQIQSSTIDNTNV